MILKLRTSSFVVISLLLAAGSFGPALAQDPPEAIVSAGPEAATCLDESPAAAEALAVFDIKEPGACPYASESPCPTSGDCGYKWDGICCVPRCRVKICLSICIAATGLDFLADEGIPGTDSRQD